MARELIGYFGPDATDEEIADAIIAANEKRKAKLAEQEPPKDEPAKPDDAAVD